MTHLRVAGRTAAKPTFGEIKATALRAGYTQRCIVQYGDVDFYGWIKPGVGSAVRFTIIDDTSGKVLNFEGWNTDVRDLNGQEGVEAIRRPSLMRLKSSYPQSGSGGARRLGGDRRSL